MAHGEQLLTSSFPNRLHSQRSWAQKSVRYPARLCKLARSMRMSSRDTSEPTSQLMRVPTGSTSSGSSSVAAAASASHLQRAASALVSDLSAATSSSNASRQSLCISLYFHICPNVSQS
ncbi:hypothetical protein DUNSADRAFT_3525 [Dunaliella salina]|uniref:Encoded protein n=1 Tax=Dunaliella salina TaxID=3046 RepID=A0ABQ7FVB3_DUNSA|nr:hypothetical protein DUNSADRAFT_3525 [Dunaliella salina]|eukprot:KAF5826329.1 hypothetical protein DUNSADRAFT_3525 [Dunaliella salina]